MEGYRRVTSIVLALALALAWLTFAVSCVQEESGRAERIKVVVSILPQVEFVEAVGGERVEVIVMVPPGATPHTHEPTPSQMVDLAEAKMYATVGSGVEFELAWMDKLIAVNKKMLVVDSARGVALMTENDHGTDPHIWLSPLNVKIMVQNIGNGLMQVDPDNRAYYTQNRDDYVRTLDTLDQEIRSSLSSVKTRQFIVFHPAWSYFSRDYDLEQIPIELGGKEPSAMDIARLIEYAREYDIKVIFASPQFNPESARVIADEIGGKVVFVDTLAGDYTKNMRIVLGELVQVMR